MTAPARRLDMGNQPDSELFGRLYADHFRAVWKTLSRLGVFPGALDDATQEVFITAWKRWSEFEGRSTHRTWLLGIAIRVASDARRKQRPTEEVSPELHTGAPGPEREVAAREAARRVEVLLSRLAPERREVLVLVDLEGYSAPEVAEATSTNVNTVYTRLRAARQEFEAMVQAEAGALR